MNQSDSSGSVGQSADLRTRIAAVLVEFFKSDHEGFVNEYEPCDDDGNPCGGTLLRIDSVLDPQSLADAVIRDIPELQARCGCQTKNWADDDWRVRDYD